MSYYIFYTELRSTSQNTYYYHKLLTKNILQNTSILSHTVAIAIKNWILDYTLCSCIPNAGCNMFPTLDTDLTWVKNTDFQWESFQHQCWTQTFVEQNMDYS